MKKSKNLSLNLFIKMIENYLSIHFPESYREFLENYEGESFLERKRYFFLDENKDCSSLDTIFYFTEDLDSSILENYKIYKARIPNNLFPIADDPFGNLILISVKNADRGKIYFWDHEREAGDGEIPDYSNLTLIADSFDDFINNLKSEEDLDL